MSDTGDFDPRFDAEFQRGYEGAGGSAPRQRSAPPRIEAPQQSVNPPRATDARARPDAPAPVVVAHPEPAVTLAGNPWITVLWVIAGVFVLGGLAGQIYAQTIFGGGLSTGAGDVFRTYVIPGIIQSVCPWMILTGLAALVGVVFLHAVRWRAAE